MTTQPAVTENPPVHTAPPVQTETRAAINAQIRSLAETAGLDRTWADTQIDGEATIDAARAAAFEAMAQRSSQQPQIRSHVITDHSDPSLIVQRQVEALAQRMGGPEASEPARQYVGFGFVDLARDALQRSGERTDQMSSGALLQRAMMTTSDFPLILEQGGNRVVMNAYAAAESPLKQLATRREVTDLRDVTVVKSGEVSALEPITESGEVKSGVIGEGAESYPVITFARDYTLSRKLLINDSLGIFGAAMQKIGRAAAATEANALVQLLLQSSGAGPVMSDGKRLFHAEHGNLADAGGALTILNLKAGRLALRSQKDIDGVTPVGVRPRYLVVGPELETDGEQILATLAATKAEDVNVFSGKLELLVEPRIEDTSWYLFGDQTTAPVLEIANYVGAPGPQVTQFGEHGSVLGRTYRVVYDVGVGAVDYRGVYRNPGAGE